MRTDERNLSAAEAARALGVSIRALKFYEQRGLVHPLRTEAGWRAYGADALSRLHQIIALKDMGLELSTIALLLKGALSSLDAVLALQEENLAARQAETERALDLVRRARARLSSGEALSVDDLSTLTRETTLNVQTIAQTVKMTDPLRRKYLTAEQYRKAMTLLDQESYLEAWVKAASAVQAAMKKGDATTPEALDAARQMRAVDLRISGGDPDFEERLGRMWHDAYSDPAIASRIPVGVDWMFFINQAIRALQAKEGSQMEQRKLPSKKDPLNLASTER